MGCESFGVVGFDLKPLLQGQTRIAKPKSVHNWLIIGSRGLQCQIMGWEFFDVIRFDLWPLFQGQMRIAQINHAYFSLICVPRGLQCHTNL